MCGIAGIVGYAADAPPVARTELVRMRDAMERRGPDGAGAWISPDQRVGLAHRRLAIIDLSPTGAQPMRAASRRHWITFNGEIYNYRALRAQLEAKGYRFESTSDTEVLLHLYADRGADMLGSLRGMYAFAIWDDERRTLFLARDPFGIKPLYYADDGRSLRFASQVKALATSDAIDLRRDAAGEAGFFTWGFVPEPFTLFRGIRSVAAGTYVEVDARGRRERAFFDLRDEFAAAEEASRAMAQGGGMVDSVMEALRASIDAHLVADVPVAAFLSAGLDSSTLVALASERAESKLHTITLGFGEYAGTANDETIIAAESARRFGTSHHTCWVTRPEFDAQIGEIFAAMDQPSTDGINTYFVSRAAAGVGAKVVLSGLGGDEMFGGYPSFRDVPRLRRFARATRLGPRAGAWMRRLASPWLRTAVSPKYAGVVEYGRTNAGAYLLRRGLFMPWELIDVMDPASAHEGWQELRSLSRLEASAAGLANDRSIVSVFEMGWYMRGQLLRDTDWAGMAHSVEVRVPYLDLQFLRAALPVLLSRSAPGKRDLALRTRPPVPDEAITRAKTGFLVPVQQWCRSMSATDEASRGLREWANIVLDACTVPRCVERVPSARGLDRPPPGRPGQRLAAHVVWGWRQILNGTLRAAERALWPRAMPDEAARVCIFRIGNIGDILCALPAMQAVRDRYPSAYVTLLTSPGQRGMPGASDLLAGIDWIDELLVYHADDIDTLGKRMRLLRQLQERRFDVWIDLPNNLTTVARQLRDMAFARLAGVRWGRGWRVDTVKWAVQAQSRYLRFSNEVDRLLDVVSAIGLPMPHAQFRLPRPDAARRRIDRLLDDIVAPAEGIVAIAPGAKRSTNRWMPDRFAQLGRRLAARGHRIVLIGGDDEEALCAQIARDLGPVARSFAGQLSIQESAELLSRCTLAICLDSGVQHLAAAVGTPVVSLFSFWQMFGKWRPHGAGNEVIQKWVPCHTCMLNACPRANLCMAQISAEEVADAAHRVLRARGARTRPVPVEAAA